MNERVTQMKELRKSGLSLQAIGDNFGISRERVGQLIGNTRRELQKKWTYVRPEGGTEEEKEISEKLLGMGIENQLMSYRSSFDILLLNGLRVDVKTAKKQHQSGSYLYWKFKIQRKRRGNYADFVLLYVKPNDEVYVVPFSKCGEEISIGAHWSRWNKYLNRFDLLQQSPAS